MRRPFANSRQVRSGYVRTTFRLKSESAGADASPALLPQIVARGYSSGVATGRELVGISAHLQMHLKCVSKRITFERITFKYAIVVLPQEWRRSQAVVRQAKVAIHAAAQAETICKPGWEQSGQSKK